MSDLIGRSFCTVFVVLILGDVGAVIRIGGGTPGGRFNAHADLQGSFGGIQEYDR